MNMQGAGDKPRRVNDPERVKQDILDVARREFVEHGLSGARINEIADQTATSKRMIYYYFTDKEGLYRAVLEQAYSRIRALEKSLDLEHLPPVQALAVLVGFTFDYHADHPDFVRLVMVENIHHARHLKQLERIGEINRSAIDEIRQLCARGVADGVFREGIDPVDVHLTISALSFYNVSNQASIAHGFGHDMSAQKSRQLRRASVIETVTRYVKA